MVERKALKHKEILPNPKKPKKRLLGAALVLFGLSSCVGSAVREAPIPRDGISETIRETVERRLISGTWEHGGCSLDIDEGKLTYSTREDRSSIILDLEDEVELGSIVHVHFSAERTIIVTPNHILVALGANDILNGREMLGQMSDRFAVENTRIVRTGPGEGSELVAASFSDDTLFALRRNGNLAWIDYSGGIADLLEIPLLHSGIENNAGVTFYRGLVVVAESREIVVVQLDGEMPATIHRHALEASQGEIEIEEVEGLLQIHIGSRSFELRIPVPGNLEGISINEIIN